MEIPRPHLVGWLYPVELSKSEEEGLKKIEGEEKDRKREGGK